MSNTKKCTLCLEDKPSTTDYFYKSPSGLRSMCKKCISKKNSQSLTHGINSLNTYYKNKEYYNTQRFKNYIKYKTGVELC